MRSTYISHCFGVDKNGKDTQKLVLKEVEPKFIECRTSFL